VDARHTAGHDEHTSWSTSRVQTNIRVLAAHPARALHDHRPSSEKRAQGMPGVQRTRSLACENEKHASKSTTGSPNNSGTPCAMVLTVSFAISLVSRALLPPSQAAMRKHRRPLDISVGISGPRDFAVRSSHAFVFSHDKRPPHPAPNVRDDREAPLFIERGMAGNLPVIWGCDQHSRAATFQHDGQITSPERNAVKNFSVSRTCRSLQRSFAEPGPSIDRMTTSRSASAISLTTAGRRKRRPAPPTARRLALF
jgi:hypothetical protein